jgi:hypothetical protein
MQWEPCDHDRCYYTEWDSKSYLQATKWPLDTGPITLRSQTKCQKSKQKDWKKGKKKVRKTLGERQRRQMMDTERAHCTPPLLLYRTYQRHPTDKCTLTQFKLNCLLSISKLLITHFYFYLQKPSTHQMTSNNARHKHMHIHS